MEEPLFITQLKQDYYTDFNNVDKYITDENGNVTELYIDAVFSAQKYRLPDPKNISDLRYFIPICDTLKVLQIKNSVIESMVGIEYFTQLEKLDLSYNNFISSIFGLENLKKLKKLDLSGNRISKIENLDGLNQLEFLDLTDNIGIKNIENLDRLVNLKILFLGGNEIEIIENISGMISLELLSIGYHIANIQKIVELKQLKQLKQLCIIGSISTNISEVKSVINLNNLPLLNTIKICNCGEIKTQKDLLKNEDLKKYLLQIDKLKNIEVNNELLKGYIPKYWGDTMNFYIK